MGKSGGIVVAIILVIGFSLYNRSSDSSFAREQGESIVALIDGYDRYDEYYDKWFEESHDIAFGEAYSGGSRRRAADFDAEAYKNKLLDHMALVATADGEHKLAKKIKESKPLISFEPATE